MENNGQSTEGSLFVRRIRDALSACAPFDGILHVSVSDRLKWEETGQGYQVLVRWACWNLENDDGNITEPEFEALGEAATRERLAMELPAFFPEIEVVVDDDIDM